MTISLRGYDTQIQLSQEELFEISQEITRLYTPVPERDFIAVKYSDELKKPNHLVTSKPYESTQTLHRSRNSMTQLSAHELCDISELISRQFAPSTISEPVSELMLLPVDPYHLYAYWAINPEQSQHHTEKGLDNPLILRIYWRPNEITSNAATRLWFDLALHNLESRQEIRLPVSGTAYSASIGRLQADNHLSVIAESNMIRVPCDTLRSASSPRKLHSQHAPEVISQTLQSSLFAYTDDSIIFEPIMCNFADETFVFRAPHHVYEQVDIEPYRSDEFFFFSQLQHMFLEHAKDINQHIIFKNMKNNALFLKSKHASGLGI
ncbi:MAG: DUF4912 domain-containing protein [Methylovulum sp.]|jgi:hypothetical protein|nr:DUF4912 domain-containing protein [Methylovulum sp.]MCF7998956.1 DUF4912 domain-containing protein [Methylovulum sp.]